MSHWRTYKAEVLKDVDKDILKKALAEMGLEMDENIKVVDNAYGSSRVDAGLKKNGEQISVGLNFNDNGDGTTQLEVNGDFHGTGLNERTFVDELSQTYQKHNVIEQCENNGWIVESVELNENGEIEIEAFQWNI